MKIDFLKTEFNEKIEKENNFKKTIEFNGTSFNVNAYVSPDVNNVYVENIQIQLKLNDVYIKADKYYNKAFVIANIKLNINKKESWNEEIFLKICDIIEQYIKNDFNDILAGKHFSIVLGILYSLEDIFCENRWVYRNKLVKSSDKEFCLSQVPEGMLG